MTVRLWTVSNEQVFFNVIDLLKLLEEIWVLHDSLSNFAIGYHSFIWMCGVDTASLVWTSNIVKSVVNDKRSEMLNNTLFAEPVATTPENHC